MDLYRIAKNLTIISDFLGKRDIDSLTSQALKDKCQVSRADLLILFGGSIPYGCDVAGKALLEGIAENFMIAGGEGHTTESLRQAMRSAYDDIDTHGKMEADIMSSYMRRKYGIENIIIERESTNCGNNVTNALEVIKQHGLAPKQIIIVQDSTMQRRMEAVFRKYLQDSDVEIINFAPYKVRVEVKNGQLVMEPSDLWGMWDLERYISLLMGEIPRLMDNTDGYGPNGKNFIAHVDIPPKVLNAFEELKRGYGELIRIANPRFASNT